MVLVSNIPIICEERYTSRVSRSSGGWGKLLNNYDLSEILNLISLFSINPLDLLSYKYILDLKDTGLYIESNIRYLYFL